MDDDSFKVLDHCCPGFTNHLYRLVGQLTMSQPLDPFNEKMVAFLLQSSLDPGNEQ